MTDYDVKETCALLAASKQAYYKHDENATMRRLAPEEFAPQYATEIRGQAPGMGGAKIWETYIKEFGKENALGRFKRRWKSCREEAIDALSDEKRKSTDEKKEDKT